MPLVFGPGLDDLVQTTLCSTPVKEDKEPLGPKSDASAILSTHLVTKDAQSFADGLYQASLRNHEITTIRAKDSGIAFLAATLVAQNAFHKAVRNVRSFAFSSDLVTSEVFYWTHNRCFPHTSEDSRKAIHTAIREGLLGKLLVGILALEELHINFHMDKLQSPLLLASGLVQLVGDHCWQHLRRIELRGVLTSEAELSHLLYRHRLTLEVILIADVVLRVGDWASFFQNLNSWVNDSRLTSENLHLDGNLHMQQVSSNISCFVSLSSSTPDGRTLAQCLSDFLFGNGEGEVPLMFPLF